MMSKYVFQPYNPLFPTLFQQEKARIAAHLPAATFEHIGSTAIPKGIIDIAIAVCKDDLEAVSKVLQEIGYEFRPSFSTPDRYYFITYRPDPEEGKRRYHVHLTYPEHGEWDDFLAVRDYLRGHPEAVQEYAEIKKQAVLQASGEGEKYRRLKTPLFEKVKKKILNNKCK
jgi:GrpB-like predicted nucleotidyltransferase (UPF0157 family)